MIVMPEMAPAQRAAWHGLLDLYDAHPGEWTLVGGQLVHLHCAERGVDSPRPTDDADAMVNGRSVEVLGAVTGSLLGLGFEPGSASATGLQHRWHRGDAVLDVLVPDGMGERAEGRPSVSGFPTVATPGGTQALRRTEVVEVSVGDREGRVPRPDLIGALLLKAKARLGTTGRDRDRHSDDFIVLSEMLAATDLRGLQLSRGERRTFRDMLELVRHGDLGWRVGDSVESRWRRLEALLT